MGRGQGGGAEGPAEKPREEEQEKEEPRGHEAPLPQEGEDAEEEEACREAQDAHEEDGLPAPFAPPAPVGGKEELHEGVARGEEAHLDLGEAQRPAQRPQDGEEDGEAQDAVEEGEEEEGKGRHGPILAEAPGDVGLGVRVLGLGEDHLGGAFLHQDP